MRRYHKAVYTEPIHWQKLEALTEKLNSLKWSYSGHCLENVKSRAVKICYRIPYTEAGLDIILVISEDKEIITIYINSIGDNHETLRKNLYIQG